MPSPDDPEPASGRRNEDATANASRSPSRIYTHEGRQDASQH
jgi:hypothetical protein